MAFSAPSRHALRRFDSPEQEAYLALWRTYDRLRAFEDELFAGFDLTAQQYNLLRVLRAAKAPTPTLALAERLVSRAPDITRMLDRLEERGLVERQRSAKDRRAVLVAITAAGKMLLDRIAGPLAACHKRQLGHMSSVEIRSLIALLRIVRRPHESSDSTWT
jgi:DNA-binding MarR family transcriptional regulator